MAEDNVVFVGSKEAMDYVLAVTTQFNEGSDEVVLKARGRAISGAVDTAEIVRNRFLKNVDILDIQTKTEELEDEEGGKSNVSAISITLYPFSIIFGLKSFQFFNPSFDRWMGFRVLTKFIFVSKIQQRIFNTHFAPLF